MSSETGPRFVIGSAMVAGAVVLAWLSSPATMELERTPGDPAQVERTDSQNATISIESRLFGLVEFGQQRIEGVRGAKMVDSRVPGTSSSTPPHLVFETTGGDVNLGWTQQLFGRDISDLRSFFENQTEPRLTLSSIARSTETRRFVIAQIVVAFMSLGGLGILWSGVKSLWS